MRRQDWDAAVLLAVAFGVFLSGQPAAVRQLHGLLTEAMVPVQEQVREVSNRIRAASVYFRDLSELRAENEALKRKVEDLTVQLVALQEVAAENRLLREQLQMGQRYLPLGMTGAEVEARAVGVEPGNLIRAISIVAQSGVQLLPDMPVVSGRGLVGRVVRSYGNKATVLLITDPNSAIAALVQRTRAQGLVRGQLDGTLLLDEVGKDSEVQEGDVVVTSGLGGVFPRGIVIGQVSRVIERDTALFKQAIVSPSVDFGALEIVLVLTKPHEASLAGAE
jgi:rod shape-determining protein MreC